MKKLSFSLQLLLGLVIGVALGFVARAGDVTWLTATLTEVGKIFVQLLKLAVAPLVFTAVVVSVANLRNVSGAARLAGKTLLWFLITSLIAVAFGIGLGLILNPGQGVTISTAGAKAPESAGSWLDFLTGIIPTNIVTAFTELNVLQIVFLGVVLGAAALAVGDKAEPFLDFSRSILDLVQKALWWVIRLAPIGTAGLIGKSVASYGWDLLAPLAKLSAGVYIGCLLVLLVSYPVLLAFVGKVSPLTFYRKAWPAIELAFVSRSSVGTMPLTQRVTTERLGVDRGYAAFAVPFGATTKMDGCAAIYPALAAIFVAQVFGVHLGVGHYLLIAFVSVVGSAATAGLTGAIVMLTLTLSTLGLPLEGVGLLLAIDPILDMIRTATNVTGQMVVPVLVARSEARLDEAVFNAPPQPLDEAPVVVRPAKGTEPALA
ncbi:dicarboxylate/amino acid:cation symporter [Microbispora bryophytorum]|uniref:Sodium:proton antiporter n=1 Tax=Microbispora bryophytorum TaxID=1460882 RepID=A0A8H9H015_9ACTN|nr:dicarboxylate/amino acid:cation symporter [Microbispora bryophytorum]MBD3138999.1 dicarboxylate/amino acid:cation symporter [Microbispora bryophytorum]TQS03082.1 dicarboxylate/amino acid:cation symporter [Microbispora bryophytorum]GGO09803.1 sodium:proton antiporter [Microbispora bryophytorum]